MQRGLPVRLGVVLLAPVLFLVFSAGTSYAVPVTIEALSIDPVWVPRNTPPASAPAIIRGIGFTPSTTVTFDGVAATVTFLDSRTLQVLVPLSAVPKVSTVLVSNGVDSDDIFPFLYTDSVCYVKPTGNDASNCLTPAAAKRTIAGAFAEIVKAGFPGIGPEIRIAAGTYTESGLDVLSPVVVSGGWDVNFTQHKPDQFVTILDAGHANFALRSGGLDGKSVIDGLTIRNGARDGLGGGGVIISGDNIVVSNSVLVGNSTSARGGAIYATFTTSYGGKPTLSRNVVLGNRSFAGSGGGIGIYPSYTQGRTIDVAISDNYILGNRSFYNRGGGLGLSSSASYNYNLVKLEAVGNMMGGNKALGGGGASFMALGGADRFDLLFDNNLLFSNMVTGEGGGLIVGGVGHIAGRMTGNTLTANTAGVDGGGGIRFMPNLVYEPGFDVMNLILWGNTNGNLSGASLATYSDIEGGASGTGNLALNPKFMSGPMGPYYLAQDANTVSPAVDAGGGQAADFSQENQTTAPTLNPDSGMVDQGFHYPVGVGLSPDPLTFGRVDPQSGDFGGSEWVLVRGTGFDPGAAVSFDGTLATNTVYASSTRLLAQPPPHARTAVNVTVTNPDLTTVTGVGAYSYTDNLPPEWPLTVGLQQSVSAQDCVRSVTLTWNPAVDAGTPPVRYRIHRLQCIPSGDVRNPCTNTGYFSDPNNLIASTIDTFYVDPNFPNGGTDQKYIYLVRATDATTPLPNEEMNYSKRIVTASKVTGDLTPPASVGNTLDVLPGGLLDWSSAVGAVSYRVYRQTNASAYATPASLVPLITLTSANNDPDGDLVTDSKYTDATAPGAGVIFHYKISAMDLCNNETRTELGP